MRATESNRVMADLLVVHHVELNFGLARQRLPTEQGYGLYSTIPLALYANLQLPLIPQGVEHYARISTLFQSLILRCRKVFTKHFPFLIRTGSGIYIQLVCWHV